MLGTRLSDMDESPSRRCPVTKPLGWATYFSPPPELRHELPTGADVQQLGRDSLITIGENPAEVPEHLLLAVCDALDERNLA